MEPTLTSVKNQKVCWEYTLPGEMKIRDKTLGLVQIRKTPLGNSYYIKYKIYNAKNFSGHVLLFSGEKFTASLHKLGEYIKCKIVNKGEQTLFYVNTDSDPGRVYHFRPRPMTIDDAWAIICQTNLKDVHPAVAVVNQFGVALLGTKHGCDVLYYANPEETQLRNLPLGDSKIAPERKMGRSQDGLVYLDLRNQSQQLNNAPVEYLPLTTSKIP